MTGLHDSAWAEAESCWPLPGTAILIPSVTCQSRSRLHYSESIMRRASDPVACARPLALQEAQRGYSDSLRQ